MGALRSLVRESAARLAEAGIVSCEVDAVALLAHAWSTDIAQVHRAQVLDRMPSSEVLVRFDDLLSERARRVPLQHLTGRAGFRHLELLVGPGVFVPRPETELLVDLVASELRALKEPVVVDLCTGSGAVAFAIKDEFPHARVYAVELSSDAVAWAQLNRDRLGLDVHIVCGDATGAFPELDDEVDVVLSNPPYIPIGMVPIDPEVRDHDPQIALYGGSSDGLAIPLRIADRAAQLLRAGGLFAMEHAATQGESLSAALTRRGSWTGVSDRHDLAEIPRAAIARRR
ncbi:MAG: peptide chain release factor N(5)-glutamine methyltransferase [Allobranchiibius sp.]